MPFQVFAETVGPTNVLDSCMVDVQLLMTKYHTVDSSLLNSDSDRDRDPDKVPRTTVDPRWTPAFYGAVTNGQIVSPVRRLASIRGQGVVAQVNFSTIRSLMENSEKLPDPTETGKAYAAGNYRDS